MWHDKGHLPPWIEVRRVVSAAVDEGLRTHSLEELVDIVKQPCREAGFKAARNKRDKDAQLKREYYNMVMDLLQQARLRQAERRRVERFARSLADNTLADRGRSCGEGVDRTNRADATAGRALQQSNLLRNAGLTRGDEKEPTVTAEYPHTDRQEQSYVKVNTPDRPVIDIPQNTGFYANFFNSLFVPPILQTPVPEADDGLWASEDDWSEVTSQITKSPGRTLDEERPDDYSEGWVDVERELDSEEGVANQGKHKK